MTEHKLLHENESLSLWIDTAKLQSFSPLSQNVKTDVCIVGGGIAGLSTAYLLAKEGKSVVVLEDFEVGSGQTGRTTAQLSTALDLRYFTLEKYHGEKNTRLVAESHVAALKKIEAIVKEENIQCDLKTVDGYLFATGPESERILDEELRAVRRAGLLNINSVPQTPLESAKFGSALCFGKQLQLHPLKYLYGLMRGILRYGGKIYTHTHAIEMKGGANSHVKTDWGFTVDCNSIVVATNSPINDRVSIHTKQASYRTYVLGFKIPKGSVPEAFFWDTLDPYHYIRIQQQDTFDVLLVGGEDHKTGQNAHPDQCYLNLETWTRANFPFAEKILYRWSGQVVESVDGIAYLGRNPADYSNVYVITGHSGNGITYSTIGALLITDLIQNRENVWERVYDPSRISLRATSTYLKENLNSVAQYQDWVNEPGLETLKHLKDGEGTVVRKGAKIFAAYQNVGGELEFHSAACPHLGGVVRWNPTEKSFDCPCHGSRFDCHGKVMEGPSIQGLKKSADPRIEKEKPLHPSALSKANEESGHSKTQ